MRVDERIVQLHMRLSEATRRRQRAEQKLADAVREIATLKAEKVVLKHTLRQHIPVTYTTAHPLLPAITDDGRLVGEVPG